MSPASQPAEPNAGEPPGRGGRPRVGYLGPEGTFTEEALLASAAPASVEPVALATIYEAIQALREGNVEFSLVPLENSLDGSISVTLDLLADEQGGLTIAGEALLSVRHSLIAPAPVELGQIDTVLTHPQVPGQCQRLLRGELAHAKVLAASSTAEAVRMVVAGGRPNEAALGTLLAAEIHGGTVLREGVQDRDDNQTRFAWLAQSGSEASPPLRVAARGVSGRLHGGGGADRGGGAGAGGDGSAGGGEWKTSLVFWGAGADSPGWLVRCLDEFSRRGINLTKIESRPKRERMGHYMFFVDLQAPLSEARVGEALAGVEAICEQVRVLGSYPASISASEGHG
jgi:prephenate dehydratase